MLFGTDKTVNEYDNGDKETVKEIWVGGELRRIIKSREVQRHVGERGDEIKDITAFFFSALGKYQRGEITSFGILPDHVDRKTKRITRIKIITESEE